MTCDFQNMFWTNKVAFLPVLFGLFDVLKVCFALVGHSHARGLKSDWSHRECPDNFYHFGVWSVVLFRSRLGAREWPGPARSCTFTRRRDACATRDTPVSNGTEWDEDKLYIIHYCRQQFVSLRTMKQCGHVDKKYLSLTVLELLTSADMSLVKVNSFVP